MMTTPGRLRYEHRQTGWMMVVASCVPALCLAIVLLTADTTQDVPTPLLSGIVVVTLVVLIGFSSLQVRLTADDLVVRFGIGLVRKSVRLKDIVTAEVVRTHWYEGWGIHWTRRGMLYNVAGFDAVRLRLVNGKALMVGSDEAERLAAAIGRVLDERRRVPD